MRNERVCCYPCVVKIGTEMIRVTLITCLPTMNEYRTGGESGDLLGVLGLGSVIEH